MAHFQDSAMVSACLMLLDIFVEGMLIIYLHYKFSEFFIGTVEGWVHRVGQ
jgi:hypothetical protein